MTRLTNYTREAIALAAISFAFDPKHEVLKQKEDKLAREAHAALFNKEHLHIIAKLPKFWIAHKKKLDLNVGGLSISLSLSNDELPVRYTDSQSRKPDTYNRFDGIISHGALADKIQDHARSLEKYKEDRREAKIKIEAMLSGITTVKKLAEAWPEGEPFYSKYLKQEAPQVPALRVEEINSMLGLPIETEAA